MYRLEEGIRTYMYKGEKQIYIIRVFWISQRSQTKKDEPRKQKNSPEK